MSDKAARKKEYILKTAKKVFAQKGFKDVTMKDIVDACDISRGGLYIYFDSTEALIKELIMQENAEQDDVFSDTFGENSTVGEVLALFLKEQKKELLSKNDNISVALYEYFFMLHSKGEESGVAKDKFTAAVTVLSHLIENGVENGEFCCEDPEGAARSIMYVIEGLKISAHTTGISEDDIDKELVYIMKKLLVDEEEN